MIELKDTQYPHWQRAAIAAIYGLDVDGPQVQHLCDREIGPNRVQTVQVTGAVGRFRNVPHLRDRPVQKAIDRHARFMARATG